MLKELKILALGDLHGRHEILSNAMNDFLHGDFDKMILIGDYADSFDRSNEDILRCFKSIIEYKEELGDDFIPLIGNHDIQYMLDNNYDVQCTGYRPDLYYQLFSYLRPHRKVFQYAYSAGNHLFTHAGITKSWYLKHYNVLDKWCNISNLNVGDDAFLGTLLNNIGDTSDAPILWETGDSRKEIKIHNCSGGPLWADKSEMINDPMPGIDHVVGHTPVQNITKKIIFNGKHIENTSVTFIDVLNTKNKYLKLTIKQ